MTITLCKIVHVDSTTTGAFFPSIYREIRWIKGRGGRAGGWSAVGGRGGR